MSIEDPTKQELPPEQPETQEVPEEEKYPIRIRTHKNLERGTELTYATFSIDEAAAIKEEDVRKIIERYYGPEIDYTGLVQQIQAFSNQENSSSREKIVLIKRHRELTGSGLKEAKDSIETLFQGC